MADQDKNARVEKAKELFSQGYNCAQAVFSVFNDETGLDPNLALRLSAPFGGGMARMREVCGAVSGMFMAAGALYGYDQEADPENKAAHYRLIQELAQKYREQNGSIICREILGLEKKTESPVPEKRTPEYYKKRPCVELVGCAVEILDNYIREQQKDRNSTVSEK